MSNLSERLILLKEKNKVLQKQIASDNGIALRTYQTYEKGTSEPNATTIIKLANYFGVSTDYLLGLTDNPEINKKEKVVSVETEEARRIERVKKLLGSFNKEDVQNKNIRIASGLENVIDLEETLKELEEIDEKDKKIDYNMIILLYDCDLFVFLF